MHVYHKEAQDSGPGWSENVSLISTPNTGQSIIPDKSHLLVSPSFLYAADSHLGGEYCSISREFHSASLSDSVYSRLAAASCPCGIPMYQGCVNPRESLPGRGTLCSSLGLCVQLESVEVSKWAAEIRIVAPCEIIQTGTASAGGVGLCAPQFWGFAFIIIF